MLREDTQSLPSMLEAYTLTNESPIVSMDIGLGKKYKDINFDYAEYADLAREMGVPTTHKAPMRIIITNDSTETYGGLCHGQRKVEINLGHGQKTMQTNDTLKHELRHTQDTAYWKGFQPDLSRRYKLHRQLNKLLPRLLMGSFITESAVLAAVVLKPELAHDPAALKAGVAVMAAAAGAPVSVLGLDHWAYMMNPNERTARQAERLYVGNVMSVERITLPGKPMWRKALRRTLTAAGVAVSIANSAQLGTNIGNHIQACETPELSQKNPATWLATPVASSLIESDIITSDACFDQSGQWQ